MLCLKNMQAHPDDIESTCGGTIALLRQQGACIVFRWLRVIVCSEQGAHPRAVHFLKLYMFVFYKAHVQFLGS